MDTVLIIIAIVALIGGSTALVWRQGWQLRTFPGLRASESSAEPISLPETDPEAAVESGRTPTPLAAVQSAKPAMPRAQNAATESTQEPIRLDLISTPSDGASLRLERIETRLDELQRAVARQSELIADQTRRVHDELVSRAEAEEARRDAAQERLRADVLAIVSRVTAERQAGASTRRMEVSVELYAQLARLETALATVTNPVLLPGEPYEPPSEMMPESLIWANWNEVGERAFALAETYSAQRLHLSGQTRSDVGAFVTTLRTLLTRSVYPNVQGDVDTAHQAALRAALGEIAVELPKIRELLETEYLEGRSA